MQQESELPILLIEDDPDAARLIQYVLSQGSGPVTVEWAADLRTGLARLGEVKFQAVLVDLDLPDSSGFDTFVRIRQRAAEAAVVVLTGEEDEALALQAVRGGADEYLFKRDVRDRFLLQRVRHAVERSRLKHQGAASLVRNGKILSFIGAKGGAGTTTVVINIAAALANAGNTVIAIELAPEYGSFAVLLNRPAAWDISTLLRVAPETIAREGVASCLEDFGGGLRALFGPARMDGHHSVSPEQVCALLGAARTLADYTLVDIPTASAPSSLETIRHSVLTTLVLDRNRIGLHAALGKMPALRAAASSGAVAALINNKSPVTEFLTPSEFGKRLGCGILGVVPPAPDLNAETEFEPFLVTSRPDIPFSDSIREVARRLNSSPVRFLAA
jgi:CheY-like chemotaxis protein/MinD-like ATPase involved in chromosome partitioning or flagellar assembly